MKLILQDMMTKLWDMVLQVCSCRAIACQSSVPLDLASVFMGSFVSEQSMTRTYKARGKAGGVEVWNINEMSLVKKLRTAIFDSVFHLSMRQVIVGGYKGKLVLISFPWWRRRVQSIQVSLWGGEVNSETVPNLGRIKTISYKQGIGQLDTKIILTPFPKIRQYM